MENLDKLISINNWFDEPLDTPIYIAGPCSAETEEQVFATASEISKNSKIKIFRAGLWKPRTRPNTFEGVGSKGLAWLKKVKEQFGLRIAVEVANPEHVELCLKNDIDVLWIGARTVSNPFSIQEIAKSLANVKIPILIKILLIPTLICGLVQSKDFITTMYINLLLFTEVFIHLKKLFSEIFQNGKFL